VNAIGKLFSGLVLLLVISATWIFVGSIDQESYEDLGLSAVFSDLPDELNGFTVLAYTQEEDTSSIPTDIDEELLLAYLREEEWDQASVDALLNSNSIHIDNVLRATAFQRFKFPVAENVIEDIPQYHLIVISSRLLIAKSISEARSGNLDDAIYLAGKAVHFTQQIKTEENYWLISHMIGLAMQYDALNWVQSLASDYDLNAAQFSSLSASLDEIPAYHEDTFNKVFSGEFLFTLQLLGEIGQRPLAERWEDWSQSYDWWNSNLEDDGIFSEPQPTEKVLHFLQVLFPGYVLQKNEAANNSAVVYKQLSDLADSYCSDTAFLGEIEPYIPSWTDIVKPNSMGKAWAAAPQNFQSYFTRRCFGHSHIEGTKAIVAINRYEAMNGELPGSLAALVPAYMTNLPLDPFIGGVLGYSKQDAWLYSVGTNFSDDGGSSGGYFVRRCENDEICQSNPTFPITVRPSEYSAPAITKEPCFPSEHRPAIN